jgi:hypothetical protein
MRDRIEYVYDVMDQMAAAIQVNNIAMADQIPDPNREGERCEWPETFLAWKRKVIAAEKDFGREPLSPLQWLAMESYIVNQYGFSEIPVGAE